MSRRASRPFVLWWMLLPIPWAWAAPPNLHAQVSDALVVPDVQQLRRHQWLHAPEVIVLYYGASWCSACHAFTPELERVRTTLRDAGIDTEVVYVSLDDNDADMRRDMRAQHMPWPAIAPRRLRTLPAVRMAGGLAPPNVVLIDRSGAVLASGWDGRRYEGVKQVLERWVELSVNAVRAEPPT